MVNKYKKFLAYLHVCLGMLVVSHGESIACLSGELLMRKITEDELRHYAAFDSREDDVVTKKERNAIRDELHSRCRTIYAGDGIYDQLYTLIGATVYYEVFGVPGVDEIVVDEILVDGVSVDAVEFIQLGAAQDPHTKSSQLTRIIEILDDVCNFIYNPHKHQIETLRKRIIGMRNKTKLKTEKREKKEKAAKNKQKVTKQ